VVDIGRGDCPTAGRTVVAQHDLQLKHPDSLDSLHAHWDSRLSAEVHIWVNGTTYLLTEEEARRLCNWLHVVLEEQLWSDA
jgi:hypothetical protein